MLKQLWLRGYPSGKTSIGGNIVQSSTGPTSQQGEIAERTATTERSDSDRDGRVRSTEVFY